MPPLPPNAKLVYKGELASAYQWPQQMFDGSTRTFECYVRVDSAVVIPFLDRDTVLLTKQEQPGRAPFIDVPGGRVDEGETNEQAAFRELHEETGYHAGVSEQWLLHKHQGMVRFEHGIYIAKNLTQDPNHHLEEDGERIQPLPTKWNDLVQLCLDRKLRQWDVMLVILGMHYNKSDRERLKAFLDRDA